MFDERRSRGDVSRWRWVLGVGVVAALGVALVLLSLRGDSTSVTTTSLDGTTTSQVASSTTEPPLTTTNSAEARKAEVELLLKDLWFGWFDAIYRKDADALWKVVATTQRHDAAVQAMDHLTFDSPPSSDGVIIRNVDVLLDRPDCLVAYYEIDVSSFRGDGMISTGVAVMWPNDRHGFRIATEWVYANDLWLQDCDNLVREVTP